MKRIPYIRPQRPSSLRPEAVKAGADVKFYVHSGWWLIYLCVYFYLMPQ